LAIQVIILANFGGLTELGDSIEGHQKLGAIWEFLAAGDEEATDVIRRLPIRFAQPHVDIVLFRPLLKSSNCISLYHRTDRHRYDRQTQSQVVGLLSVDRDVQFRFPFFKRVVDVGSTRRLLGDPQDLVRE
jgi:hypothetical protein